MIVLLTGYAGAGKDTLAERLLTHHNFVKFGFAFPLKRLCADLYGWDFDKLDKLEYKESPSNHEPFRLKREQLLDITEEQFGERRPTKAYAHLDKIFGQITPSWTRRQILQHVGTEGFRAIDPDHWIKKAVVETRNLLGLRYYGVVLTDLRFPNELSGMIEAFGEENLVSARIERIGGPPVIATSNHSSETSIDDIPVHHVITAEWGDMEGLRAQAASLLP